MHYDTYIPSHFSISPPSIPNALRHDPAKCAPDNTCTSRTGNTYRVDPIPGGLVVIVPRGNGSQVLLHFDLLVMRWWQRLVNTELEQALVRTYQVRTYQVRVSVKRCIHPIVKSLICGGSNTRNIMVEMCRLHAQSRIHEL